MPGVPSYSKNEDVLIDFISMGQPIYLFVALVVGLFVGAGTIWLILRVLSIRLTEQLIASQQDTKKLASELDALAVLHNQITIEKQELNTEIVKLTTTLELERSQAEEKTGVS